MSGMEMAVTVVKALQDLLKYKVVGMINTGDRRLDNMFNVLFISMITIVFSSVIWKKLYVIWFKLSLRFKRNTTHIIEQKSMEYYTNILRECETLAYCQWDTETNKDFNHALGEFINKYYGWTMKERGAPHLNMDTFSIDKDSISSFGSQCIIFNNIVNGFLPIYIGSNRTIVGLYRPKKSTNGFVYLVYQSIETAVEFSKYLKNSALVKKDCSCKCKCDVVCKCACLFVSCKINKKCICVCKCSQTCQCFCICDGYKMPLKNKSYIVSEGRDNRDRDCYSVLFVDRSFDRFISRHKRMIINMMDAFINTQKKGISRFNGMGTYNLGIMLRGVPGTGKTLLIKSICNYIGRSAKIVDMTKVKTISDFNRAFYDEHKYVFVLDEFDCVQGIIANRRLNNTTEEKHESKEEMLNRRYIEVLSLMSSSTNDSGELTKELERIKKEKKNLKNSLTLSTMLTLLDGMIEVRGRIMVATTNHLDHIDPALLRGGRFDIKINLGAFNSDEIKDMLFMMFKGAATGAEIEAMQSCEFPEDKYTPVNIVQYCTVCEELPAVVKKLME